MTREELWLGVLQQVAGLSAHEIKGALNGVALSLEVVRSRTAGGKKGDVADFATSAADHLELVTARVEALLYLTREANPPAPSDLGIILRHLAALLEPAAKADGGSLSVEGLKESALTSAPVAASRLALAAGLLALIKEGGTGGCRLTGGAEPVVRFSHQSATACSLGPEVTQTIAADGIRVQESDGALTLVFPKSR
jgi:signal transduction histidine kinase